ncbi:P-loop containing nucleoside triphosphate hydrolase protein [Baffinella frigidus]|nr:P-loop containing nucleoside triphosphate hydrolase protein [Cryptophyta sp. CCMP2293]
MKKDNENAVTLSTIHHSKGLEWPHVYLGEVKGPALEKEWRLVYVVCGEVKGPALEEERRLVYVAITRARTFLSISYLLTQTRCAISPSQFLRELPKKLLKYDEHMDSTRREGTAGGEEAEEGEELDPAGASAFY